MGGNMECIWGGKLGETYLCGEVQFVVAWICDKCAGRGTVDLCNAHFTAFRQEYDEGKLRCSCGGMLSYKAQDIYSGDKQWQVTRTTL